MKIQDSYSTGEARHLDRHIGGQIRLRRILLGFTQEQLAKALSLSYQQIQKYEIGANRINAARLFAVARVLDVEVGYFFAGFDGGKDDGPPAHGGRHRGAIELMKNFVEIRDEELRAALAHVVKAARAATEG